MAGLTKFFFLRGNQNNITKLLLIMNEEKFELREKGERKRARDA